MPINASHEYFSAEKKYLAAQTLEEKIVYLQEMIRTAPKHKGSENLLAELRLRLKKFRAQLEKSKKSGKGKKGIKKEGFQVVLVGKTNSGKSMLLNSMTNANSKVGAHEFTTKDAVLGTMNFEGVKIQVIDVPSIGSKDFDYGIVNTADLLLIVIESLSDLKDVEKELGKTVGKRLIVINKIDLLKENEKRKLEQQVRAKRIKNYVLVSAKSGEGVLGLKSRIFEESGMIRVYTKEPGKPKEEKPVVLRSGSCVRDVAETIYKGFSKQVKECRLTGPSGKFSNQRVGLAHVLKDKDIVEFKV